MHTTTSKPARTVAGTAIAVAAMLVLATVPAALAAPPDKSGKPAKPGKPSASSCVAQNVTNPAKGKKQTLETLMSLASPGDTITVSGTCPFPKSGNGVTLLGKPTNSAPTPTLVVDFLEYEIFAGQLTLTDLTVTGGLWTDSGTRLTLAGTTSFSGGRFTESTLVTMNDYSTLGGASLEGAGIEMNGWSRIYDARIEGQGAGLTMNDNSALVRSSFGGRFAGLLMNDNASISGNSRTAVDVTAGGVTMNDNSTITDNHSTYGPGGVFLGTGGTCRTSSLTMNDSASITGNSTTRYGGGVLVDGYDECGSRLTMNGSASITDNIAGMNGGGVHVNLPSTIEGVVDGVNVTGNLPNNVSFA